MEESRNSSKHHITPDDGSLTDSVREESTDAVDRAVVVQHASEGRDVVGGHVDIRGKLQLVPGIEAGCVQPHLDSLFSPSPSHGPLQPWIAGLLRCCAVSEPEEEGGAGDGCVVTSRGGVDRRRPETSNPVDCRPRLCRSPNFGGGGGHIHSGIRETTRHSARPQYSAQRNDASRRPHAVTRSLQSARAEDGAGLQLRPDAREACVRLLQSIERTASCGPHRRRHRTLGCLEPSPGVIGRPATRSTTTVVPSLSAW